MDSAGGGSGALLIALMNIFDTEGAHCLSKEAFVKCTSALGYVSSDTSWEALAKRFGLVQPEAPKLTEEEALWRRPHSPPAPKQILDLGLVADHFVNKYDSVLEELLRRLLGGILTLADRVQSTEADIYNIVHREEIERQRRR